MMLSLLDALRDFLNRWEDNVALSEHPSVNEGVCALCQETRYVQYNIQIDASFCSLRCAKHYNQILKTGMTYASQV